MIESRFPILTPDDEGYTSHAVKLIAKSTLTDPAVSDMLDAQALREKPSVSRVSQSTRFGDELDEEKNPTGRRVWTRVYFFKETE